MCKRSIESGECEFHLLQRSGRFREWTRVEKREHLRSTKHRNHLRFNILQLIKGTPCFKLGRIHSICTGVRRAKTESKTIFALWMRRNGPLQPIPNDLPFLSLFHRTLSHIRRRPKPRDRNTAAQGRLRAIRRYIVSTISVAYPLLALVTF